MIVYNLACVNDHRFEGWFSSSADYERQTESKFLTCPLCASDKISRLPHAPYVSTRGSAEVPNGAEVGSGRGPARPKGLPQQYANLATEVLSDLIEKVLEKTEDVGSAFPDEARRIHYKEAPERCIRGTANAKEVEALREEGIEVVALPVPAHLASKMH